MPPVCPLRRSRPHRAAAARSAGARDDVGMRIGPAAAQKLGELALELGDLAGGRAAAVAADRRGWSAASRASWPRIASSEPWAAAICCSRLASSVRAADMRWPIEPAPGSTPDEALLELDPALLGLAQLRSRGGAAPRRGSCSDLAGLAAVAGQVLLDEQVEQALDGRRRRCAHSGRWRSRRCWRSP